jgi:hypothetical protein
MPVPEIAEALALPIGTVKRGWHGPAPGSDAARSPGDPPMIDDQELGRSLRAALPPVGDAPPPGDLRPVMVHRRGACAVWPWVDLGVALAVAVVLAQFPGLLWLLVYHL